MSVATQDPMLGKKFCELTVLEFSHSSKHRAWHYKCICSCGNYRICSGNTLRRGYVRRCPSCTSKFRSDRMKTHGMTHTSEFVIWSDIVRRCTKPYHASWADYGGRGITVCERWLKFENFYEDMGNRPEGLEIDRIDNDKGYFKENCRWTTRTENNRNRRPTSQWAKPKGEAPCQ